MEIFRTDGHLTDEALAALVRGGDMEELSRLEAAEHLAFCDLCLQRYTESLEGTELLTPLHSCRESLWKRVRLRTFRLAASRYATAAAAVVLALTVVWGSGSLDFLPRLRLPEERPAISQRLSSWPERWSSSLDRAVSGFNDIFSGPGTQRPGAPQGGNHS